MKWRRLMTAVENWAASTAGTVLQTRLSLSAPDGPACVTPSTIGSTPRASRRTATVLPGAIATATHDKGYLAGCVVVKQGSATTEAYTEELEELFPSRARTGARSQGWRHTWTAGTRAPVYCVRGLRRSLDGSPASVTVAGIARHSP
jgi:hypothetical protein